MKGISQISKPQTTEIDRYVSRPRPKEYKTRNIPRHQKTTTKEGFNEYMRNYMRIRRAEQKKENET